MPQKAADRLGISASTGMPRKINVGDDAIILRHLGVGNGMLVERLKGSIGRLVVEMSNDGQQRDPGEEKVDATFLRALGEVVKRCERDCFGYH